MSFPLKLHRILDRIEDSMAMAAAALLLLAVVLVTIDVAFRFFVNQPLAWVFEVTEYILLFVPCLGMAWLAREDGHVMIDIVTARLAPRIRNGLSRAVCLTVSAACLFTAWWGWIATVESYRGKVLIEGIVQTPQYLVYCAIPLGFLTCGIEFARKAMRSGAE